jgi:hypothetical protein
LRGQGLPLWDEFTELWGLVGKLTAVEIGGVDTTDAASKRRGTNPGARTQKDKARDRDEEIREACFKCVSEPGRKPQTVQKLIAKLKKNESTYFPNGLPNTGRRFDDVCRSYFRTKVCKTILSA